MREEEMFSRSSGILDCDFMNMIQSRLSRRVWFRLEHQRGQSVQAEVRTLLCLFDWIFCKCLTCLLLLGIQDNAIGIWFYHDQKGPEI